MSQVENRVALITGANRGIGFETAKELGAQGVRVVLAVRDLASGEDAAARLKALGVDASVVAYEAGKPGSAQLVAAYLEQHFGKLDILVNNAGVLKENLVGGNNSSEVEGQVLRDTFEVNFFAVIELTQALLPLIKHSSAGRIVNLSSILASLSLHSMPDSPIEQAKSVAYNTSKTALNAYTVHLAHELKDTGIKVNAAHPGWVKTELGGAQAPMEVDGSGKTSVQLAILDAAGPTGGFFHDGETLPLVVQAKWSMRMRINRKYKLPIFAVFMSASTSLIVSATILWLRGVPGEVFLAQWLQAFTSAWPVVFVAILLLAPPIDRMLERVVDWT